MSSWVRYSVAVYVGLLLAGALVIPKPEASAQSDDPKMPPAYERLRAHGRICTAVPAEPLDRAEGGEGSLAQRSGADLPTPQ